MAAYFNLLTRRKAKLLYSRKTGTVAQADDFCDGNCPENLSTTLNSSPASTTDTLASTNAAKLDLPPPELFKPSALDINFGDKSTSDSLVTPLSPPWSPTSEISDSSDASSIGFDISQVNSGLHLSEEMGINLDDLAKILSQQSKALTENWAEQISKLSNAFQKSHVTPAFPSNNSVPIPKFSGDAHEDVNEFLANFDRTSAFYHLTPDRKAEALPLFLTGSASIWFNTTPELNGRSYAVLSEALKKQFHSESDIWLLRQQLNDTKQLATEPVSTFAAKIRRLCQRINLPRSESINYFIQGLRPHIKNYVLLQRPGTFEDAEMHAKLKESLPEQEKTDRTDEILRALAKLQQTTDNKLTPPLAAFGNCPPSPSQGRVCNNSTFLDNSDLERMITQCLRQELRRSHDSRSAGQTQRGRRSFDGRPICDFCGRAGHIMATCYKRNNPNRYSSIPDSNQTFRVRDNWEPDRLCPDTSYQQEQQHLNW